MSRVRINLDMTTKLNQRTFGYELSGSEYELIFERDDMGYVRYISAKQGAFYLDPAPWLPTPKQEVYICKTRPFPPKGKLIEVTVLETERVRKLAGDMSVVQYDKKYVTDWHMADPNKLRGNRLIRKEDFLNVLSLPMRSERYDIVDTAYGVALYMMASPQLTDMEPGGINADVIGKMADRGGWAAFNHLGEIVPGEFRQARARNYYRSMESAYPLKPVGSVEVSLAYDDQTDVPVDIAIPFDSELRPFKMYSSELKDSMTLVRSFMLDAILFQPEVPPELERKVVDAMTEVNNNADQYKGNIPFRPDYGAVGTRLAGAMARLNFKTSVTADDLTNSVYHWSDALDRAHKIASTRKKFSGVYELTPDAVMLLADMKGMLDTGVPLTMTELRKRTRVFEWRVNDAFQLLRRAGHVYTPGGDRFGLIGD